MQKCDCCNYAKSDISQVAFKSNLVLACNSAAKPSFFEKKIAIRHAKKNKQDGCHSFAAQGNVSSGSSNSCLTSFDDVPMPQALQ